MPKLPRVLLLSSLWAAAWLGGCASPQQKLAKCKTKCTTKFKSEMVKNLCKSRCEGEVYGELDEAKLESLCGGGDAVACLRFASKAVKSGRGEAAAAKLQACCDEKKTALCCGFLGKMYQRGKIMKLDKPKGYALMVKACEMGDSSSCASPGLHYLGLKEYPRALKLLTSGCDGDRKDACGLLGVIYRDGKGVPRDLDQARKLMDKGCRLGSKISCDARRRL